MPYQKANAIKQYDIDLMKRGNKLLVNLELEPIVAGELYYQVIARLDYFEELLKKESHRGYERIKQITTIIERLHEVRDQLLASKNIKFDR